MARTHAPKPGDLPVRRLTARIALLVASSIDGGASARRNCCRCVLAKARNEDEQRRPHLCFQIAGGDPAGLALNKLLLGASDAVHTYRFGSAMSHGRGAQ